MTKILETTVDKFIFRVETDRYYNSEGVWAKEEDGRIRIGLSDFVQQRSGDVAFAEVKPVGTKPSGSVYQSSLTCLNELLHLSLTMSIFQKSDLSANIKTAANQLAFRRHKKSIQGRPQSTEVAHFVFRRVKHAIQTWTNRSNPRCIDPC